MITQHNRFRVVWLRDRKESITTTVQKLLKFKEKRAARTGFSWRVFPFFTFSLLQMHVPVKKQFCNLPILHTVSSGQSR